MCPVTLSFYGYKKCSGDITGRPLDREAKERSSISRVKDCCRGMGVVGGQAGIKMYCIVEELKVRKEKEEKGMDLVVYDNHSSNSA